MVASVTDLLSKMLRGDIAMTPAQLAAWEFDRLPGFMREAYGLGDAARDSSAHN